MSIYQIFSMFIEGLASFVSPCILPLVPLYIGYLTSDCKEIKSDGTIIYQRKKVFLNTIFFVLGISMTFFILGLSISLLKSSLIKYQNNISLIGGALLIIFGLWQARIIRIPFLEKTKRLNPDLSQYKMGIFKAFGLGFVFSFAWTPCIGPMLSSSLILAASSQSWLIGNLYILAYALGFIIPFLLLGIFTEELLNIFKKQQKVLQYAVYVGSILLITMGGYMIYTSLQGTSVTPVDSIKQTTESNDQVDMQKYDFTLADLQGEMHTLSDNIGSRVIVTFFSVWCEYCQEELSYLNQLKDQTTTKIILVAIDDEKSNGITGIKNFIQENGYEDLLVLVDDGKVFAQYGISGYPTTYVYQKTGNFLGYLPGMLTYDILDKIANSPLEELIKEE